MSARLLVPALVAALAAGVGCSGTASQEAGTPLPGAEHHLVPPAPGTPATAPPPPTFTLFTLAEVRGQVGPCGCTSDPLGDLARTVQVVADARRQGPVLVVDAGGLLYAHAPVPAAQGGQAELKASLLLKTYQDTLGVAAIGLGPVDLGKGAAQVRPARQAANVTDPAIALEPPKVVKVGDAPVGIFGVVATDALTGVAVGDPIAAGKAAVAALRGQGARVVIGLLQARTRKDAARLARDIGGLDVAVAGLGDNAPEPDRLEAEAERLGDGYLVIPANRGQTIGRIEVTLRPSAGGAPFTPLIDAIGPDGAKARITALDRQLTSLDADLARFAADPSADKAFVAAKRGERDALAARRDALLARPLVVPDAGSYFTFAQVRIGRALACNADVAAAITAFDAAAGEANVKAAASLKVPRPAKGAASYVGTSSCGACHEDEVKFWKQTHHANAWRTLVDRGQQFDYECINCHVTGFDKPGGSNLAHNDTLRDVQCEVCHGPASIHVARKGNDEPTTVHAVPAPDLCASECHTKQHSDTFQLEAYLRDVTGPGHGEDRRKALGDGPTGASLRKVALDKAGKALGAGCKR